jgi:hypothetical protein
VPQMPTLAGVTPIEAFVRVTCDHCLRRRGNRRLNMLLYLAQQRSLPAQAYMARPSTAGGPYDVKPALRATPRVQRVWHQ